MKMNKWLVGVLAVGTLVLAGCGKSQQQQQQGPPPVVMRGVKVDLPKLQQSLTSDNPALQAAVSKVTSSLRYGLFSQALTELQKLSGDPSLTEAQKKVVSDVIEQVKQMAAKEPAK